MTFSMEETIGKLQKYSNSPFPILSVYLTIPQIEKNRNKQLAKQFQTLIDATLKSHEISLYQQDINYIDAYIHEYKHTKDHRGIAIFSGGNKAWEVITLMDKLPDTLTIRHEPHLEPLLKVLELYRRYLIILADREKAKFFTLHMGQMEAQGKVEDPSVPQKVRAQGSADLEKNINSHIRDHLHKHFVFIGQKVNEFVKDKPVNGIIIGGHKEIMRNMKESLPKHLQQKVVGEFISELNVNMNEILKEAKGTVEIVNKQLNQQQRLRPV